MKQLKVSLPDKHIAAIKECASILGVSTSRIMRECIERCEDDIYLTLLKADEIREARRDVLLTSKGIRK